MIATERSDDFSVKFVTVKSVRGGVPDSMGNNALIKANFKAAPGHEQNMSSGAVPDQSLGLRHILRVDGVGEYMRGLLFLTDGSAEIKIDEGRITDRIKNDPLSYTEVFDLDGPLLTWKIKGLLIPDASVVVVKPSNASVVSRSGNGTPKAALGTNGAGSDVPKATESSADRLPTVVIKSTASLATGDTQTAVLTPSRAGENVVAKVVRVPIRRIKRFDGQPRRHFRKKSLLELGQSLIDEGQQQPITVVKIDGDPDFDYELVNGERRWRAAHLVALDELDCIVKDRSEIPDRIAQHRKSIVANLGGEQLSKDDTIEAVLEQRRAGASAEELGRMFKKSAAWARNYLSVENLITLVRRRLDPTLPKEEQIAMDLAILIAKAPQRRQEEIFNQVWAERGSKLRILKARSLVSEFMSERGRSKHANYRRDIERVIPAIIGNVLQLQAIPARIYPILIENNPPAAVKEMRQHIADSIKGLQELDAKIQAAQGKAY
ncbi:MAG: ParB N-terminal domain-containing protein [Candidatus Taylorbacteria bacterium]|nr:ParB N-terminal domain-containing protein [Candidatus Taylorbacteria bacterium]